MKKRINKGWQDYSRLEKDQAGNELGTNLDEGLSQEEAVKRLKKDGKNVIHARETRWWSVLLRQFKSPFIYLLAGASVIAYVLGESIDGTMILVFVGINVILGYYQEIKSENILKILKKFVTTEVWVKREGEIIKIRSEDLVAGDVVVIKAGDVLQADIRIIESENLVIDESILSGEAVPITKDKGVLRGNIKQIFQAKNIGFSQTAVVSGKGAGVVIATGIKTEFGIIGRLTAESAHVSGFEKELEKISKFILRIIGVTLVLVLGANLLINRSGTGVGDLMIFAIALAVSVIPEALPAVMTFSLSRGAMRLAKKKVVVKRLSSIEDLGSIEILCTDKTGTITENRLNVDEIFPNDRPEIKYYVGISAMDTESARITDPFDTAIIAALGKEEKDKIKRLEITASVPFDPKRKRNAVVIESKEKRILVVRGAYEEIAKLSNLKERKSRERWIIEQARKGNRVIAVGQKELKKNEGIESEENLEFVGLISFSDPIKTTTRMAVVKAGKMGVGIKVLTGDSKEVAGQVAKTIGLIEDENEVITGEMLEQLNKEMFLKAIEGGKVFARVAPDQKFRIVSELGMRHEVGFLGEGINDAPALKASSVGLVVEGASDIAIGAADIVLLNKSLNVIINGIEEGREVFANSTKYIKATLSSNFGNFYAVALISLMVDFLPLLPLQILLLNLLSDFPMIAIATDNVDEKELEKPSSYDVKEIAVTATLLGLVSTLFDFIYFGMFYRLGPTIMRTNWFMGSIITELMLPFAIRTKMPFYKAVKPSILLVGLTVVAFGVTVITPFTKWGRSIFSFSIPTARNLITVMAVAVVYFAISEGFKLVYYRVRRS